MLNDSPVSAISLLPVLPHPAVSNDIHAISIRIVIPLVVCFEVRLRPIVGSLSGPMGIPSETHPMGQTLDSSCDQAHTRNQHPHPSMSSIALRHYSRWC